MSIVSVDHVTPALRLRLGAEDIPGPSLIGAIVIGAKAARVVRLISSKPPLPQRIRVLNLFTQVPDEFVPGSRAEYTDDEDGYFNACVEGRVIDAQFSSMVKEREGMNQSSMPMT